MLAQIRTSYNFTKWVLRRKIVMHLKRKAPGIPVIPTSQETEVLVQGWGTDLGVGIDRQTPVGGSRGEMQTSDTRQLGFT